MNNIENTWVKFWDFVNKKVVKMTVAAIIECGSPVDEDGDDMEVYSNHLFDENDNEI